VTSSQIRVNRKSKRYRLNESKRSWSAASAGLIFELFNLHHDAELIVEDAVVFFLGQGSFLAELLGAGGGDETHAREGHATVVRGERADAVLGEM